jgi:hypothetical protein
MKHEKFRSVQFNNRKKVFHLIYTSGLEVDCPYSAISVKKNVVEAGPDKEVGNHSFYFILEDGYTGYVPYDQPLHIINHPDYVKEEIMWRVTIQLRDVIASKNISKREIARRMNTSVTQINRLLDQTNYNKDLSRLIEMAAIIGYEFDWSLRKAA